jgi:hypothetical protein
MNHLAQQAVLEMVTRHFTWHDLIVSSKLISHALVTYYSH